MISRFAFTNLTLTIESHIHTGHTFSCYIRYKTVPLHFVFIYHVFHLPRPPLIARGDLSTGPSCLGSPASTSWPPTSQQMSVSRIPATAIRASGSTAWPASSMKTWLKWPGGKFAEASLSKECEHHLHFIVLGILNDKRSPCSVCSSFCYT